MLTHAYLSNNDAILYKFKLSDISQIPPLLDHEHVGQDG